MKKLNIKKALSASFAALMLFSAIASVKPNVKAYAAQPFIADTDNNGAYNIDESQIKVDAKRYYSAGTSVALEDWTGNGTIKTKGTNKCTVLDRRVFSVRVVKESGFTKAEHNKLTNMTLTVTYYIKGRQNKKTYKPTVPEYKAGVTSYDVSFNNIITRGESYTFETSAISISGAMCNYAANAPAKGNDKYYMVTATSNGENIVASIKYNSAIKYEYLTNWAKRICMYANSLSETTGITLDTLYICLDYPDPLLAFSYNGDMNSKCDLLGFVGLRSDISSTELNRMAIGNNEITWCMLHEIAHSYALCVKNPRFINNYGPGGDDDFYCNARGITAIQNCDNLRSTKIYHSDRAIATYDQILDQIFRVNSYPLYSNGGVNSDGVYYTYARKLVNIGKKYGWDKLENFFAATSDYNYNSTENKNAAKAVNALIGKSYSSEGYLRTVNAFRKLYKTSWYQSFNYYAFQSFVKSEVGVDLIKATAELKKDNIK